MNKNNRSTNIEESLLPLSLANGQSGKNSIRKNGQSAKKNGQPAAVNRILEHKKDTAQRLTYEKPLITMHSLGATNKYTGRAFSSSTCQEIDGVNVPRLLSKFGSPLYVVSEQNLRNKYREFIQALRGLYPDSYIAYSYKTNYLSGICSIFHQEGAWAEVVSGLEYGMALEMGVDPSKIVFNGTHKASEDLIAAIKGNSMIHIDSFNEIYQLESLSVSKTKPANVGVRVNMNVSYPPWNKFGFNLESGQAFEACRRVASSGSLRLNGLHCHLGTYVADSGAYYQGIMRLIDFALKLERDLKVQIEYLDMGGGYASANTLHSQFLSGAAIVPTLEQYAHALCQPLRKRAGEFKRKPRLILEPGRGLVDEAISLVTTVVATKRFEDGRKAIIVDAGVNILPTAYWFKHEIASTQDVGSNLETVNIYGPLCMQIDVLRTEVRLPPFQKGHILVIKNVGAYNMSQSMQFIYARPAVVVIHDGKAEYLRLPESPKDFRRLDVMPAHLEVK
ncbi:MAG: alanine racemase [Candidatus Omnitrophica bacterium]|nr:alanine racemase [Candidatus Omnitrophota bacterium]